jgi:hypothetical protein
MMKVEEERGGLKYIKGGSMIFCLPTSPFYLICQAIRNP